MNAGLAPADVLRMLSRSSEFLPHFALVPAGPSSVAPMVTLALGPDRASWFPALAQGEAVEGRFVARLTAHIGLDPMIEPAHGRRDSRLVPAFRGWSTVVLTAGRLVGICPRGDAVSGPVDFARGTVVAWSFPLRHVDTARVVDAGGAPVVAVRSTDRLVGGVTLAAVHRVVEGGLQPIAPEEMAATLNTATRRLPDGARSDGAHRRWGSPIRGSGGAPIRWGSQPVELNRARRSLPADLPRELLAVIGLLCVAGLFTGIPVLQNLPDAFELLTEGGLWDSFGLLVVVLLAELGLFAVACFLLAWQLSQGDPVARVVTVVVAGSLAFGLLLGNGLDDGSATVTLLCSIAAVVALTVPPRVKEFFADRAPGPAPTPVVAAEALLSCSRPSSWRSGVAYLPLMSVKAKYALVGLGMIGIAVSCFRGRRRLSTGDPGARTLVSGLMAGAVVAMLLGGDGSLTGPLYIPLGMALAIVGLLWVPPESQAFFTAGRSMDVDAADGDGSFADYAEPAAIPPVGSGSPSVRVTSARLPLPSSFDVDDDYPEPPPPPPAAARIPTPPFAPGPAPSPSAAPPRLPPAPAPGRRRPRGPSPPPTRRRPVRPVPRPRRRLVAGGAAGRLLASRAAPGRPPPLRDHPVGPDRARRAPGGARPRHPLRHHLVVPGARGAGAGAGRLPGLDGDVRRRVHRHRLPGDVDPAGDVGPPGGRVRQGRERGRAPRDGDGTGGGVAGAPRPDRLGAGRGIGRGRAPRPPGLGLGAAVGPAGQAPGGGGGCLPTVAPGRPGRAGEPGQAHRRLTRGGARRPGVRRATDRRPPQPASSSSRRS